MLLELTFKFLHELNQFFCYKLDIPKTWNWFKDHSTCFKGSLKYNLHEIHACKKAVYKASCLTLQTHKYHTNHPHSYQGLVGVVFQRIQLSDMEYKGRHWLTHCNNDHSWVVCHKSLELNLSIQISHRLLKKLLSLTCWCSLFCLRRISMHWLLFIAPIPRK